MMEQFALYLLKSVVWLTGFTLVYSLFLRNERFFFLNRFYLLGGIVASFIFPFISIHYTVIVPMVQNSVAKELSLAGMEDVGSERLINFGILLIIIYITGVLFAFLKLFGQNLTLLKVIKRAEISTHHSIKLIRTAEYPTSFSFFSYVFVNPSVADIEAKEIMNHELVHVRQMHWVDLVLIELLNLLQWFNPIVWIYSRFIRQNHEYLADEVALQRSTDPAIYRAALLNQIVGSQVIILANSFNYSITKKRFVMMKNIIRSPYRKLKILLVLPVIALVLYSFAKPEYRYVVNDDQTELFQTEIAVQDTILKAETLLPAPPPPPPPAKTNTVPPPPPPPAKTNTVPPPPPPPAKTNTVPPPPPPAKNNAVELPPSPSPMQEVIKIGSNNGKKPLIVIDGKITDIDVRLLDPNSIEMVDVIKDNSATDKYGEQAENGVIEITSKKTGSSTYEYLGPSTGSNQDKIQVVGYGNSNDRSSGIRLRNYKGESLSNPMIVLDGEVFERDINEISLNYIHSLSVIKGEAAIRKYGEKAKDGVIIITSKKK